MKSGLPLEVVVDDQDFHAGAAALGQVMGWRHHTLSQAVCVVARRSPGRHALMWPWPRAEFAGKDAAAG